MTRALLIVLDSVGIGGAPDAAAYGDEGADTVGHIAEACAAGAGDRAGLRSGPLRLPHLAAFGLRLACEAATGRVPPGLSLPGLALPGSPASADGPAGAWGVAREASPGKDTPSGHWEIAGGPVDFAWGYFPDGVPAFPAGLVAALVREAGLPGILGDRRASGTAIVDELGAEHLRTGRPICYASADSVFQIAAHEEAFGLERLYETCRIARRLCDPLRIGRVIARPFTGDPARGFVRTAHRRDFAIPPPAGNLLDRLAEAGRDVVSIGKVGDVFAHRSTGREVKTADNAEGVRAILARFAEWGEKGLGEGGLVFANLVDFDTEHGHRRDVAGYAAALEAFDRALPAIRAILRPGDLAIVTADHGNDPTAAGTDHTREQVPVLCFGPHVRPGSIGARETFADLGATLARHLGVPAPIAGTSFLDRLTGPPRASAAAPGT